MSLTHKPVELDVAGLVREARVSEAYSTKRTLLTKLRVRHLAEGRDWVRVENNAVALTAEGMRTIDDLLLRGSTDGAVEKNRFPGGFPAGKPPPKDQKVLVTGVSEGGGCIVCLCLGLKPSRAFLAIIGGQQPRAGENVVVRQIGKSQWECLARLDSGKKTGEFEPMSPRARVAEQLYTLTDVARMLQVPAPRLRELQAVGEFPNPDVLVPGGGRKAERWSATAVAVAVAKWSPSWRPASRSND